MVVSSTHHGTERGRNASCLHRRDCGRSTHHHVVEETRCRPWSKASCLDCLKSALHAGRTFAIKCIYGRTRRIVTCIAHAIWVCSADYIWMLQHGKVGKQVSEEKLMFRKVKQVWVHTNNVYYRVMCIAQ